MTASANSVVSLLDHVPGFITRGFRSNARPTRLLRPMVNAVLPDHEVVVTVRSGVAAGLKLPILPRSEKFYWTGVHEEHLQHRLAQVLRPGMTFWDVGAHIGFFSLLASRIVTSAGHIHAFEPFPPNQQRLGAAIRLNDADNITVHPRALAEHTGAASFHVSSSSLMGSLESNGGGRPLPVECVRADDVMQAIQRPDVVKIDAEGAELSVLRGARTMLARVKPMVLVELTSRDMLNSLHELTPGYRDINIGANHWLLEPR